MIKTAENKNRIVDTKRVIAQTLIAQREVCAKEKRCIPQCVSIERIQATIKDLRPRLQNHEFMLFIDGSRDAIESAVFFNSLVLDMNEDAGLVYFKDKEPENSNINDEYYLSNEVKRIISDFTLNTLNMVF